MTEPITPLGPLSTLRNRLLLAAQHAAAAKFVVRQDADGALVSASLDLDYPTALDGSLAALFQHLEANMTGDDALGQLAAIKAAVGVT